MYRIVNRCFMHLVVNRQSAMFLAAALILLAIGVESAAGSSGRTGTMAKHSARHGRKRPAPAGVVFGSVTAAGFPVVIEVSRDGREVVRATIAVPVKCQSGGEPVISDYFAHVPISATGAFQDSDEGTSSEGAQTMTFTNRMTASINPLATSVAGTWSIAVLVRDASGATIDHCDSGAVSFTAIQ
ncbi:MAG: hypothetical protein ACHQDY_00980 [Solirubrobacterales bacterium]